MSNLIKKCLEDKEYKNLTNELVDLQIKEMVDQKWYPKEIQQIKEKIKLRLDILKNQSNEHKKSIQ